jgi:signal peptidase II
MAFGIMNRQDVNLLFYFLLAATIGAIILLVFWFFRLKQAAIRTILGLSLILGGALGNLIDRLRFGEVIDFVDFYVGPYHWPAFNVADSAITVGTFLVAIGLIFQRRADS